MAALGLTPFAGPFFVEGGSFSGFTDPKFTTIE
jgi:hypothetical protein